MNVINTNSGALKAANASNAAGKALGTAMERLSTGKRINSAKDDAAGLAITTSMTSQVRGMNQGIRNANDGISMAQTAEGALSEVTNMLQRQRELTVQASNNTYSADDLANLASEMTALNTQITSVLANSEFNGQKLFDASAGTAGVVTVQAGANEADAIDIDLSANLTTDADLAAAAAVDVEALAAGDIALFDTAIKTVSTVRAGLGASQNQLESAVTNLNEFFDRFRQLNIGSNEQLDSLVDQCRDIVGGVAPKQLRDDVGLRSAVAADLAEVRQTLDELLVDRPRRNILRRPR